MTIHRSGPSFMKLRDTTREAGRWDRVVT
jgi:hypothetical protein